MCLPEVVYQLLTKLWDVREKNHNGFCLQCECNYRGPPLIGGFIRVNCLKETISKIDLKEIPKWDPTDIYDWNDITGGHLIVSGLR